MCVMILVDKTIRALINNKNLIECYDDSKITNIGYDLRTESFHIDKTPHYEFTLEPGASVFVSPKEIIHLPDNLCAFIALRNGRIRQGLSLDAPVYQPGHSSKPFFRLTNITSHRISLSHTDEFAMIVFEILSTSAENPYTGRSMNEFTYDDLGRFEPKYKEQIQEVEEKVDDVKEIERSIYANVLVILTIFVALFTFLTTNVNLFSAPSSQLNILFYELFMLGCISFLVYLLGYILKPSNKTKTPLLSIKDHWMLIIAAILVVASIIGFSIFGNQAQVDNNTSTSSSTTLSSSKN